MTQPALLPLTPPQYTNIVVHEYDLPPNRLLEGPDPDKDLIESVRAFGVIDPLTVVPVGDVDQGYSYLVLDGGRRTKAIRFLLSEWASNAAHNEDGGIIDPVPDYLANLPARIPQVTEGDVSDVLALQKHSTRKRNPISEYQRVKRLLHGGHDIRSVVKRTGMTTSEIQKLLRLDGLPIALLEGASEGKVSMGQAYQIVALPEAARERLEQAFVDCGRKGIKTSDITAQRQARVESATVAMDWGQIDSVPESTTWTSTSEELATQSQAMDLGLRVLEAIQGIENGAISVSLDVDGKYTVTVSPGSLGSTANRAPMAMQVDKVVMVDAAPDQQVIGSFRGVDLELLPEALQEALPSSPFHLERQMMAADGDPQGIGCPVCPSGPGSSACYFMTPEQEHLYRGDQHVIPGDESRATANNVTIHAAAALLREAEASVRLDGETQPWPLTELRAPDARIEQEHATVMIYGRLKDTPVGVQFNADTSSSYDLSLPGAVEGYDATRCEHGSAPETCELMPCKRKRQKRDFGRRKRAAAKAEANT